MKPHGHGKVLVWIRGKQRILYQMGHESFTRLLDLVRLAIYVHTDLPESSEFVGKNIKRGFQDACDRGDTPALDLE
jgi:hypothetical protein